MTTTKQLTGEEARRLWFEGVLGWKQIKGKIRDNSSCQYCGNIKEHETNWWHSMVDIWRSDDLPPLHNSLDLQEEWVWPALFKEGYLKSDTVYLERLSYRPAMYDVLLISDFAGVHRRGSQAPTKAMAQLLAALKAMGKG